MQIVSQRFQSYENNTLYFLIISIFRLLKIIYCLACVSDIPNSDMCKVGWYN